MKKYTLALPAVFMSLFSLSAFAAEQVSHSNERLVPIKSISVRGAGDYQDIQQRLSALTDKAGGTKYRIILLAGGENGERATAIAYQ